MVEIELELPKIEDGWEVAILESMTNVDGDIFSAKDQGWNFYLVVRRSGQVIKEHVPKDSKILGGIVIRQE